MSLVFNSKTFNVDITGVGFTQYAGPANTFTTKDLLKLGRIAPTRTNSSGGVAKTSSKLTRTLTLTGQPEATRDAIVTVDFSVPVGFASADVDALVADVAAFVATASFKELVKTGKVAF